MSKSLKLMATHLPPELWLDVFSNLSPGDLARVSRACRHLRDVAELALYTSVSITVLGDLKMLLVSLIKSSRRCSYVVSLSVDWSDDFDDHEDTGVKFWQFHSQCVFGDQTPHAPPGTIPKNPTIAHIAAAHNLSPSISYAISKSVVSAQVVLLLELLPRLRFLHIFPSPVEFWFWAAFPDPCAATAAKRLPRGLMSLESLDVHYRQPGRMGNFRSVSEMNHSLGFAHVKVVSALLLPSLRRLSYTRDDGDQEIWQKHYAANRGSCLDMKHLVGCSGVSDIRLRGAYIVPNVLLEILLMLAAPEKVQFELLSPLNCALFDEFIGRPTLHSFTVVEHLAGTGAPFASLGSRDHLTHIALPVRALGCDDDDDLAVRIPVGIAHLDLAFPSVDRLREDISRLTKLVSRLAETGRFVRHLTIRPALCDAYSAEVARACVRFNIQFSEEQLVETLETVWYNFSGGPMMDGKYLYKLRQLEDDVDDNMENDGAAFAVEC